jgi:hypothetical protein
MSSRSDLRKLSDIIRGAVDKIDEILETRELEFPSLDTPYSQESEAVREIPEVFNAVNLISAAGAQLTAITRPPTLAMLDNACKVCAFLPFSSTAE